MLGQRYTTPMVTVVCHVTSLHHMASLQSASSCNCTSYAGMVSLMYNVMDRHFVLFIMLFLIINSTYFIVRGAPGPRGVNVP